MSDLYPRPSREEIARRVAAPQPGTANDDDDPYDVPVTPREKPGSATANFAVHLSAKMRALGLDGIALAEKSGLTKQAVSRALTGAGVSIGIAEQLAESVGGYLAHMIGPYSCGTCAGEPPKGFSCLECGSETRTA